MFASSKTTSTSRPQQHDAHVSWGASMLWQPPASGSQPAGFWSRPSSEPRLDASQPTFADGFFRRLHSSPAGRGENANLADIGLGPYHVPDIQRLVIEGIEHFRPHELPFRSGSPRRYQLDIPIERVERARPDGKATLRVVIEVDDDADHGGPVVHEVQVLNHDDSAVRQQRRFEDDLPPWRLAESATRTDAKASSQANITSAGSTSDTTAERTEPLRKKFRRSEPEVRIRTETQPPKRTPGSRVAPLTKGIDPLLWMLGSPGQITWTSEGIEHVLTRLSPDTVEIAAGGHRVTIGARPFSMWLDEAQVTETTLEPCLLILQATRKELVSRVQRAPIRQVDGFPISNAAMASIPSRKWSLMFDRNDPTGAMNADAFDELGFNSSTREAFNAYLLQNLPYHHAVLLDEPSPGHPFKTYRVEMPFVLEDGSEAVIRSLWHLGTNENAIPILASAYVATNDRMATRP